MIEPYFLSKTGLSLPYPSSFESLRTTLSSATTVSKSFPIRTRITSWRNLPASQAWAARKCDRCAHASCASREMPFSLAIFSADSPIESPVEYSAMEGGTGSRSRALTPWNACSFSTSDRPRLAATTACAMGRE